MAELGEGSDVALSIVMRGAILYATRGPSGARFGVGGIDTVEGRDESARVKPYFGRDAEKISFGRQDG